MKRDTYLKLHEMICHDARGLSARKGHDYSGDTDTLANLKRTEALEITSAPKGVLVRLGDKLSRAIELLDKEAQVEDEKLLDTIEDGINYWILLAALLQEQGRVDVPPEWLEKWDCDGRLQAGLKSEDQGDGTT